MSVSSQDTGSALVWTWKGKTYELPFTAFDVLKLARAVEHEGYPADAVLWTLAQRAGWLTTQGKKVSLGRLVEQYAQPINPAWFPDGEAFRTYTNQLLAAGKVKEAENERVRAQARIAKAREPWDSMALSTHALIAKFLTGQSASPVPGAVHYWASRATPGMTEEQAFAANQAKKPGLILMRTGYGQKPGRNVFFAEKGSIGFTVHVRNGRQSYPSNLNLSPEPPSGGGGGEIVAAIGLAGLIGFFAFRRLRG